MTAIQNNSLSLWASIFAMILCVAFGLNAVAVKISFKGVGVFTSAALRFSMASFSIIVWALLTKRKIVVGTKHFPLLLISSFLFLAHLSIVYFGISKTYASRASLIINLHPVILLFLAHFFIPGDKITARKIIGLIASFSGLIFFFYNKQGITSAFTWGDILVLLSTFIWACNTIVIKRLLQYVEPHQVIVNQMILMLPFFYLFGYLFDTRMIFNYTTDVVLALLYQGFITASLGYIAWTMLLKKFGAVALHSYTFIMPVAGVFFSFLLLNEPVTSNILIALVCVTSGILIVNFKSDLPIFPIRKSGI